MFNFEFLKGQKIKPNDGCYVLVSDIGGTNANFALAQLKKTVLGQKSEKTFNVAELILKFKLNSKKIDSFTDIIALALNKLEKKFNIEIKLASLACAGVVSIDKNSCKMSNIGKTLYKKEILEKTNLEKIFLLNDFESVGYGIQALDKDCLVSINETASTTKSYLTKAYLGAGTGLGKGILYWNKEQKLYIPKPSEGGHADFAAQDNQDLKLLNFIKLNNKKDNIEWENVLSGQGLKTIFQFLFQEKKEKNKYIEEIIENNFDPVLISKYKNNDSLCKKTFEIFTKYYARCAKCFALDTLSIGGIYIAGGIATKNLDIFKNKIFMQEFTKNLNFKKLLEKIPIHIVKNYDVGLLGAAIYSTLHPDNFL